MSAVTIHRHIMESQTSHTKVTRYSTRAGQQQSLWKIKQSKDTDTGENCMEDEGDSYKNAIWHFFSISTSECSQLKLFWAYSNSLHLCGLHRENIFGAYMEQVFQFH